MPKDFCLECGIAHVHTMEACQNVSDHTPSTKKSGKASKEASQDVSPTASLTEDFSSLSLLEREKRALADIEWIELEDRVLALEEKRAKLLYACSRRRSCETEGT